MSTATAVQIARYVDAVRAALADLPPGERDELLEDLRDHLAEVAADGEGSLEERLGPPAAYAAELRSSAGLRSHAARETVADRMAAVVGDVRAQLARFDVKAGPVIGYAAASDFVRLLRPAWWVLRGYVVAMAVSRLIDGGAGGIGVLPRLGGSMIAGLLLLFGAIVGSIWLGRRWGALGLWGRRAAIGGTALAVLVAAVALYESDRRATGGYTEYVTVYDEAPGVIPGVSDVYVYDSTGRLLSNVRLFDQNGQPIQVGEDFCEWTDRPPPMPGVYPRCPDQAPFQAGPVGAEPSPATRTEEPTATAPPSPGEQPTATAPPSPGEKPAPTPTG